MALGVMLLAAQESRAQAAQFGRIDGTVWDSLHAAPLSGASVRAERLSSERDAVFESITDDRGSFRFDSLPAGRYSVSFASALLDSLEYGGQAPQASVVAGRTSRIELAIPSASTLRSIACPGVTFAPRTGALVGHLTDADLERPLAGAGVLVAWTAFAVDSADGVLTSEYRSARATTDASGAFHLCGVPTESPLALQVQYEHHAGAVLRVSVAPEVGLGVRNLSFSATGSWSLAESVDTSASDTAPPPFLRGSALLVGTVRSATGVPVADANVSVAGTGTTAVTDARGEFTLNGLPSGSHDVEVRRIGFQRLRHSVELRPGVTVRYDVHLQRVVLLDSVAVVAQRRAYPDFESHRKFATNGRFITDADFDWHRLNGVSDILTQVVGFAGRVVGVGSNAYVPGCTVVVDNMVERVVPGSTRPGGQLNNVSPSDVGAMEFYPPGSRSAPAQFRPAQPPRWGMPSDAPGCVIMIWTKSWAAARASSH